MYSPVSGAHVKAQSWFLFAMAVCCALVNGCVLSEHHEGGGNAWFTLTKYSDDAWLLVGKDFSYSCLSSNPESYRQGRLDDATGATLQDLLAPESIRHYVDLQRDVGWNDRCLQEGVNITFWRSGAACWFPAKVTDESTKRMLEYLLQLFERLRV